MNLELQFKNLAKIIKSVRHLAMLAFMLSCLNAWAQPNCSSNAGLDETICSNGSMILKGTAGTVGAFAPNDKQWVLVSGSSSVSISTPTFNVGTNLWNSTVTGFVPGTYIFKFRALCTINGYAEDFVVFTVVANPPSFAGPNVTTCSLAPFALSANTPTAPATGTWSASQGSFSSINSPTATYTPVAGSSTVLTWTTSRIQNGVNCLSQSNMTVKVVAGATVSAGPTPVLIECAGNCRTMQGSNPGLAPQSGFWTLVSTSPIAPTTGSPSSPPVFGNPNSPSTSVCNLEPGFSYTFQWTVSGPCTNGSSQVVINVKNIFPPPNAGPGSNYFSPCNNPIASSQTLVGGPLTANETATWTQVSPASPTATFSPSNTVSTVTVSGLSAFVAPFVFSYTKINTLTLCSTSASHIIHHGDDLTNFTSPTNQTLNCDVTNGTFNISYTDPGSISTSLTKSIVEISRPSGASASSAVFSSSSSASTTRTDVWSVSNMVFAGVYTYMVTYNNACGTVTKSISFTIGRSAALVNAGTDILVPCGQLTAQASGSYSMSSGTPSASGIISWSFISGPSTTATITNGNGVAPIFGNYVAGKYTFRMSVETGSTCSQVADNMFLIVPPNPVTVSNAGTSPSGTVCAGQYRLDGNIVADGETGTWTVSPALLSGGGFSPNANNPKAIVTGMDVNKTYVFRWTIVSNCGTNFSTITLNTSTTLGPPIPNAGTDQCLTSGSTSANLTGSSAVIPGSSPSANATLLWTPLDAGSSVSPSNTRNTTASITGGSGVYRFEYTTSVATCQDLKDTVVISVNASGAAVSAGTDQNLCGSSLPANTTLNATPNPIPSGASGIWTQIAGPTNATISTPTAPSTNIGFLFTGIYNFRYTQSVGSCASSFDEIQVNLTTTPTISNAGSNQSICGAAGVATFSATLTANTPTNGSGFWSIVSSPSTLSFSSLTSPSATVTGLTHGTHVLRWTITGNAACPPSTSDVTVFVAAGAYAGPDVTKCDVTNFDLKGSAGTTGTWTNVSGSPTPTITAITSSYSVASGLTGSAAGNQFTFRYSVAAVGSCAATFDDVILTNFSKPSQANAGTDQEACWNATTATLTGNAGGAGIAGTGKWFFETGPNTPTTSSVTGNPLNVSNVIPGLYLFRYELNTDPTCIASKDYVQIFREVTANAGADIRVCNVNNINLNGNSIIVNTGTWTQVGTTPSTAVFANSNDPKTNASSLVASTTTPYTFTWTIASPSGCPANSDQVTLIVDEPVTGLDAGPDRTLLINSTSVLGPTGASIVSPAASTTFSWLPAYSLSSYTIEKPTFTVGYAPGVYTYTLTGTNNTCSANDDVVITVLAPSISGKLWDDGNGLYPLATPAIDGVGIGSPSGTQVYAYLTLGGAVIDKITLPSTGVYSFLAVDNIPTYDVVISSTNVNIGGFTPAVTLPSDWFNVGEQFGTGNDKTAPNTGIESGTPNGIIQVKASVATGIISVTNKGDVTLVDFGIDKIPVADSYTIASRRNPGTNVFVSALNPGTLVPLTGTDLEDIAYNASSAVKTIVVSAINNGSLQYNGVAIINGTTIVSFNPSLLTVDPTFLGTGNVTFQYQWQDSAHLLGLKATVTIPFTGVTLSGNLYDDGNGDFNTTVDGTLIGNPKGTNLTNTNPAGLDAVSGTTMFAYLVDRNATILGVANANFNKIIKIRNLISSPAGVYSFSDLNTGSDFEVFLSSSVLPLGSAQPSGTLLPNNWVNTGENYGSSGNAIATGNVSTSGTGAISTDGAILVTTTTLDVPNVNFGIEVRPESINQTITSRLNPGGAVAVSALNPGSGFMPLTGSDKEDGAYSTATSSTRTIQITNINNGTLFYNSVAVTSGTTITNFDQSLLTVDPTFLGTGAVTFNYAWQDNNELFDLTPALVTIPFDGMKLSGTLWDDGNGDNNNAVDGTAIGNPVGTNITNTNPAGGNAAAIGSPMYVYLVDRTAASGTINTIIQKVLLPTSGALKGMYTFSDLNTNNDYEVFLDSVSVAIGSAPPSSSLLPNNWVRTGENYGTNNTAGSGLVSVINPAISKDGKILVSTLLSNITGVDFGIDNRPESLDKTITSRPNPGGTTQVSALNAGTLVPLTGLDNEDGAYNATSTLRTANITNITNGSLYYDFGAGPVLVVVGTNNEITNFDPSKLTVDPTFLGGGTVTFNYAWKDAAGFLDLTPALVTIPFDGIQISGKLWDDGNGDNNGAVDGNGIGNPIGTNITNTNPAGANAGSGTQMYVYLVDRTTGSPTIGQVLQAVTLATSGSTGQYSFTGINTGSNYEVFLSSSVIAIGTTTAISTGLPNNWVNTGENYGNNNTVGSGLVSTTSPSTSQDGAILVTTSASNVTTVDFGIDNRPESIDKSIVRRQNPGGSTQVSALNAGTLVPLTGSDLEDGTYNATSTLRTVEITNITNGSLFYNGTAVANGTTLTSFDPSLLTVDPTFLGAGSVTFNYAWKDAAGFLDLTPALVNIPFGLSISGTIYDDGDGNLDLFVDGAPIANPAGTNLLNTNPAGAGGPATQLYVALVDRTTLSPTLGQVISVYTPATSGSTGQYFFENIDPNANYEVYMSATLPVVGTIPPASTNLPNNWVNTGENLGTNNLVGSGLTTGPGSADGRILVNTSLLNVPLVDFGIDLRPESADKTAPKQSNPGGTIQVPVPTLTGSDLEDGTYPGTGVPPIKTIIIETLPTNGTLYYNGVIVPVGRVIANYNPALLTVDPTFPGAGTIVFTYAWKDSAQQKDLTPATVSMPFGMHITGTLYHDANGLVNGLVDGVPTGVLSSGTPAAPTNTQVYAYLVDALGNVEDKVTLNPTTGFYDFTNANENTSYIVKLSTTSVAIGAPAPATFNLPGVWVATGEQFGVNNTVNSGIESGTPNGIISVTTTTNNVSLVDFGVEFTAFAHDKSYTVDPADLTNLIGAPPNGSPVWGSFVRWVDLYGASGTNDSTLISGNPAVKPGKLSAYDQEDGRYAGTAGLTTKTMVLNTLPDSATDALLQYEQAGVRYRLVPNPGPTAPSYIFWNSTLGRYEIPNFDPTMFRVLLKFAYQAQTEFTYSFIDAAGLQGRVAFYRLVYTVPLPVSILKFTGKLVNNRTDLTWVVASEVDIQTYSLYRKPANGGTWIKLNEQKAKNNNTGKTEYYYTDFIGTEMLGSYLYELKVNESNGKTSSGGFVIINLKGDKNASISVSPNPTSDYANIVIFGESDYLGTIGVFDAKGNQVLSQSIIGPVNMIHTSNLSEGIYFVNVNLDGITKVVKLVVARRN